MVSQNRNFHNPEYKARKRKVLVRRIVLMFILICILVGGLAGVTHWRKVMIQRTYVYGTVIINPDDVRAAARMLMSGNDIGIFAKNNAVLYPHTLIQKQLSIEFPRIKTISVGLSSWDTLEIDLSERQPVALWCDNPPSTGTSTPTVLTVSNCYFLDQSGFVFAHAPDFSGDAYFKYYGLLPYASPIGQSYLASLGTFSELSSFVDMVKALNVTPLYIVATDQDDFTLYTYGGGQIIFDDTTPLADTAHNLQVLLQTPNLIPQKNGELLVDYIDLRFGNKLYYKVRS
jgi:cell division septal protein FtsQ